MIRVATLHEISSRRMRDARALLSKRRYEASVYMSGYAIETALKYKICKIFGFRKGFPESKSEFQFYLHSTLGPRQIRQQTISGIREIKNHNLDKLLFYSGLESNITNTKLTEWNTIRVWNPEMRYQIQTIRKLEAETFLTAINILIKEIL